MEEIPDAKMVTVHDSIIVKRSQKDAILKIFEQKLEEEFGMHENVTLGINI
jgi:hypothetical protein